MSVLKFPSAKNGNDKYSVFMKDDAGEICLYGAIGGGGWFEDGVSLKQFSEDMKKFGNAKTIDVRINSYGGDAIEGRAMYNILHSHKAEIKVHIDGVAASAASLIAMAGDTIEIAEGGYIMIHNAHGLAIGGAKAMRETAALLDSVSQTYLETYQSRTGCDEEDIKKMMDAETWMTGKEALAKGFANSIVSNKKIAACAIPSGLFKNVPTALAGGRTAAGKLVAARAKLSIERMRSSIKK